jgi:hypothetical protein
MFRAAEEALDVRWIRPDDLDSYEVPPSMREQIGHYLAGTYPYLG